MFLRRVFLFKTISFAYATRLCLPISLLAMLSMHPVEPAMLSVHHVEPVPSDWLRCTPRPGDSLT